ncbi:MAG: matrixin family metalloprotease [Nitrososphaerales archaeon]
MKRIVLLALLVIFIFPAHAFIIPSIEANSNPSIKMLGTGWPKASLNILVIPQSDKPWFKESYIADIRKGLDQWRNSIFMFTYLYGYSYLNKFNFNFYVFGINATNHYDVFVEFKERNETYAGYTWDYWDYRGSTYRSEITIYCITKGHQMTDEDMMSVFTHEFGHALGLDHANQQRLPDGEYELMYSTTNTLFPSTLDLYALALNYQWLDEGGFSYANGIVTLPPSIPYRIVKGFDTEMTELLIQINKTHEIISNLQQQITLLYLAIPFLIIIPFLLGLIIGRLSTKPKDVALIDPSDR